ncbi:MAG TPA: response regulator [Terracidiphilus sp.]|nr:response regulator [Terracidiphilus sp.]
MILLVEEDPLQALVRLSALRKRFPDVNRVATAAEALCLIEQPLVARGLNLVITGDHLPDLEGSVFVAELESRMPSLPVLVLGNSPAVAARYSGSHVRFLAKPIAAEAMLHVAVQMVNWGANKAA